jgi:hypothetical protein
MITLIIQYPWTHAFGTPNLRALLQGIYFHTDFSSNASLRTCCIANLINWAKLHVTQDPMVTKYIDVHLHVQKRLALYRWDLRISWQWELSLLDCVSFGLINRYRCFRGTCSSSAVKICIVLFQFLQNIGTYLSNRLHGMLKEAVNVWLYSVRTVNTSGVRFYSIMFMYMK